jgi:hypothetical protein
VRKSGPGDDRGSEENLGAPGPWKKEEENEKAFVFVKCNCCAKRFNLLPLNSGP